MDPLQELRELEELKKLKARYFYFLDTKDWDSWLSLFAPDATLKWDTSPATGGRAVETIGYTGIEAIAKHVVGERLDPAQTMHQGHMPLLDLTSETTARGIWAMEDFVNTPDPPSILHGFGHYHETYRKSDGQWKITSLHLKRLRMTIETR